MDHWCVEVPQPSDQPDREWHHVPATSLSQVLDKDASLFELGPQRTPGVERQDGHPPAPSLQSGGKLDELALRSPDVERPDDERDLLVPGRRVATRGTGHRRTRSRAGEALPVGQRPTSAAVMAMAGRADVWNDVGVWRDMHPAVTAPNTPNPT